MASAPHPFTLRQLQYFVEIAQTRSFRRAADACHVSQPALSAQLAALEAALGVRLFDRDRRHVLPTAAGQQLLDRARRTLLDADDLIEAARLSRDPLSGTLRIGVIPTLSPYLLPELVPAVHAAYPRLTILWIEQKTEVLIEQLQAGALDGALLALEASIGDVDREIIGKDPFVLAAPLGHPLAEPRGPARLRDLDDSAVLLLDEGHCLRDQALAFCKRAGAHELDFRATSLSTLVQIVASGAGVTLLPRVALPVETRRAEIAVRPITDPAPYRTIALAWRRGAALGPALRTVAATFKRAYQEAEPRFSAPPNTAPAHSTRTAGGGAGAQEPRRRSRAAKRPSGR